MFCSPVKLCSFNCVNGNISATESHRYLSGGPLVCQHCSVLCGTVCHMFRYTVIDLVFYFKDAKSGNAFLCNALRFPKEYCFLECSQASPVCLSGNSNKQTKLRMEHWWNDTDRGEWSIGGMILTGESGALVECYWQGRMEHW